MNRYPPLNFPPARLAPELERDIQRLNPWWQGELPALPPIRRHLVAEIHRRLDLDLAPIVVVRGSRRIGKTIAQMQVLRDLLDGGVHPRRILRLQCDELEGLGELKEPFLRVADWYEEVVLGKSLNRAAQDGEPAFLFFDEVQVIKGWAPQLKFLVDASKVQIVATGSSAMRIEAGRDSLAGRITTLEAGTLSLTEIARFRGLDLGLPFLAGAAQNGTPALAKIDFWRDLRAHGIANRSIRDQIFELFAERGGYPLAHLRAELPWSELVEPLNETVIARMLRHDLQVGPSQEKLDATVLETVFRLACRYAGQTPSAVLLSREVQSSLGIEIGPQEILDYLRYLGDTLLVRRVPALELRLKKERRHDKICLADHSLRASWLAELIPMTPAGLAENPHLAPLAGHLAESIVGAALATVRALDLAHRPARGEAEEIDFVLSIGLKRLPMEVKYQHRIHPERHTKALRAFLDDEKNQAPFGLLITQSDLPDDALDDPRIVALPLSSLLLVR
jgi:predicted AAA+ superfamily ATPase